MSSQLDEGSHVRDPNVDMLVTSASRWLRLALTGWADDDFAAVAMLAPIATEHLGKAALWKRHPALLVPLASNAEESLRILISKPSLGDAKLRTVGLHLVLQRLQKYIDPFPLDENSVRRLVAIRNGSVHVGLRGPAKRLLPDVLTLCQALLNDLGVSPEDFYGDQEANVRGILDEKRTQVQATVAAKMARARNHLSVLEERLGADLFEDATSTLAADATFAIDAGLFSSFGDTVAVNHECPVCGTSGRLIGRLDADPQVDWDVEKIGDHYESYVAGAWWELVLTPHDFACNVCKLDLSGPEELAAAGLPAAGYELDRDELDEDFDVDEHARSMYTDYD